MIDVAGGWGYENLGDEAILAGYVEHLQTKDAVRVLSVNPNRTRRAQLPGVFAVREASTHRIDAPLVIGGGGYLNGRWLPEIYPKLGRLAALSRSRGVVAHGIEVRRMDQGLQKYLLRRILHNAETSVRDSISAENVARTTGMAPPIVPDAISLLVPYLDRYLRRLPIPGGKVVINILDIASRGDVDECEVDVHEWDNFVQATLTALGEEAIILVGGEGDRIYANRFDHRAAIVEPHTVSDLVSLLDSARSVLSVRMHPALLASALSTPVVAVPYCGKVRPTLEEVGVGTVVLDNLDVNDTLDQLNVPINFESEWRSANYRCGSLLDESLERLALSLG